MLSWRLLAVLITFTNVSLAAFETGDQLVSQKDDNMILTLVEQTGNTCVLVDTVFSLRKRQARTLRKATKEELLRRGTSACRRGEPVWVPAANKGVLMPGIAEGLIPFDSLVVCRVQIGPTKHSFFPESVQPRTITPADLSFDEPLEDLSGDACAPGSRVEVLVGTHSWTDGIVIGPTSLPQLFRVQVGANVIKVVRSSIRAKVKQVRNGID